MFFAIMSGSGETRAGHQECVEGDILQEVEFETDGEQVTWPHGDGDVFAGGAECGECVVGRTGEFEAGRDERSVELDDALELDFDAELDGGRRESLPLEDPSAAVSEGVGESGKESLTILVAVALQVVRLGFVF